MSEKENLDEQNVNGNTNDETKDNTLENKDDETPILLTDEEKLQKLIEERVNERLKPLKDKLDSAYSKRDEALAKKAEAEQKLRDAEIERLKEQGKHQEVLEMQLEEERAKRVAAEKRNVELSRDSSIRQALVGLPFRNEKAAQVAYREIVEQTVQNEQGVWVHKSGISINDFIVAFAKDEDQAFLFKAKANNGAGTGTNRSNANADSNTNKSLLSLSNEELIKRVKEGTLRK